jgi:hypothetical protein
MVDESFFRCISINGCDAPASPSCGSCLGAPKDTHARMNEPQACSLLFFPKHLVIDTSSILLLSLFHLNEITFHSYTFGQDITVHTHMHMI